VGQCQVEPAAGCKHAKRSMAYPPTYDDVAVAFVEDDELAGVKARHGPAWRYAGQRRRFAPDVGLPHSLANGQGKSGYRAAARVTGPERILGNNHPGAA